MELTGVSAFEATEGQEVTSQRQGKGLAPHPLEFQFSLLLLPFINLILMFIFPLVNYFCCDHTVF